MSLKKFSIIVISVILVAVYVTIFILPGQIGALALIPEKFYFGEWWRFVTFQFSHLNEWHLVENIAALVLVGLVATELKTAFGDFSFVYFLTGSLAVLPLFLLINFTALGASGAIYGALGLIAIQLATLKLRPEYFLAILTAIIFFRAAILTFSCVNCESAVFYLRQGGLHFSGLIWGLGLFVLITKLKRTWLRPRQLCLRQQAIL